jgi:hypothetical protein
MYSMSKAGIRKGMRHDKNRDGIRKGWGMIVRIEMECVKGWDMIVRIEMGYVKGWDMIVRIEMG